jgi:hypothetical protein
MAHRRRRQLPQGEQIGAHRRQFVRKLLTGCHMKIFPLGTQSGAVDLGVIAC